MLDLAGLTEGIAAAIPERECLVWRDRRLTWADLDERVRRLATALHDRGVGGDVEHDPARPWSSPHDHVALYLLNGPEYVEALLAAPRIRAAAFNVNHRYVGRELEHLFGDARPRAIVFHGRFAERLDEVRSSLPADVVLLQVEDETGAPLLDGAIAYEDALAGAGPGRPGVTPHGHDLHLLYTGGTTGMPKGVLWRLDDWIRGPLGVRGAGDDPAALLRSAVEAAVAGEGRVLPAPPLMHGSGTWSAVGGLCRGRTVVIQDEVTRFDAADVVATIARERVTSTMIIGDAFARPLVAALEETSADVTSLRTILNSGAALHPTLRETLERLCPGVRIVDTVGSSESGPQAMRTDGGDRFRLAPGAAVLVEDRSRVMAAGEEGEGWLARQGRMPQGYLGHPEATARTFPTVDGVRWVLPGDKVRLDAEGTVRFLGRDATTINTGGEKVFAEEVELVLRGIPGVRDAIVTGRPSERWGSEVTALVELEPGAPLDEDAIRRAARAGLADYKVPKAVLLVEVRRLPNGKADTAWARDVATASVSS